MRPHPGTMLGLLISTAGAAIPFGFQSGGYSTTITNFEWVLTGCFMVSFAGLVLRYFRRLGWWAKNALLLVAASWVAAGVYVGAFDPRQTWRWRVAFTMICVGIGVVALFAFAGETSGSR